MSTPRTPLLDLVSGSAQRLRRIPRRIATVFGASRTDAEDGSPRVGSTIRGSDPRAKQEGEAQTAATVAAATTAQGSNTPPVPADQGAASSGAAEHDGSTKQETREDSEARGTYPSLLAH
mmetsp:Transcript_36590/g.92034  ORF Transcript_36590/g.92034 Transcript_36590/m.92034 type:complete len:120 (-) Transcript_36590:1065-1424(-)